MHHPAGPGDSCAPTISGPNRTRRLAPRLPRHARGISTRRNSACSSPPCRTGGRRVHLRLVCPTIPPDFDKSPRTSSIASLAPQGFPAQGRQSRRLRGRSELETRLGKQPRVLPLNANHPQYIKANFDITMPTTPANASNSGSARPSPAGEPEVGGRRPRRRHHQTRHGPVSRCRAGTAGTPRNRTALVDGYVSETMNGRQVAPLMGDYPDADVGTLRVRTLPNCGITPAATTRSAPGCARRPRRRRARGGWCTRRRAGRDYISTKLTPFWGFNLRTGLGDLRTPTARDQFQRLPTRSNCPTFKEYNVDAFIRWYLKAMRQGG